MSNSLRLCTTLAEGTARQKSRAWVALVQRGGLWRGCEEALQHPGAVEALVRAYDSLRGDWVRTPLLELHPNGMAEIERHVEAACRIVAAGVVAAVARYGADDPELIGEWAPRALGASQCDHRVSVIPGLAGERELVRHCFRRLAETGLFPRAEVGSAQNAALGLLAAHGSQPAAEQPTRHRVPILLTRGSEGVLAWLWLESVPLGFGTMYQAPSTQFDLLQANLLEAVQGAWKHAGGEERPQCADDVCWWFSELPTDEDGAPVPVHGASLQAAAAAAFALILAGRKYDPTCAIAAVVVGGGALEGVAGLYSPSASKYAAAQHLAAYFAEPVTVVVSAEDAPSACVRAELEAMGIRVEIARTVAQAAQFAALREDRTCAAPGSGGSLRSQPMATARPTGSRVVLLFVPDAVPDEQCREGLETGLRAQGCQVFVDRRRSAGVEWIREVEQSIRGADAAIALLSAASAASETLGYQLQLAQETVHRHGRPRLMHVWIEPERIPRACLRGLVSGENSLEWRGPEDDRAVISGVLQSLRQPSGPLTQAERQKLIPPTGVVPLDSRFYVSRDADAEFLAAVGRRDSIVRVKGARQMGKTSLLARGLQQARDAGARVILTDMQLLNEAQLTSPDTFLLALARWIARQLDLDISPDDAWDPMLGANWNFREFVLNEMLDGSRQPVVWAMDEVDRLFTHSFSTEVFALFRSWHNERALNPGAPWSRLTLALSHATEGHMFITDPHHSPFNVGTRVTLGDFELSEVRDLNQRYGEPLQSSGELNRFLALFGGQPFLSHRAMHQMVVRRLSLAALEAEAERDEGLFGDHLRRLLALISRVPELVDAVHNVLRGMPCPSSELFYRLWSAGVLSGDTVEAARPRCELYTRYLARHLK